MGNLSYSPKYNNSYALIIGINNYLSFSPLVHAANDAKAIAELLEKEFEFKSKDIKLLLDKEATRNAIMSEFMSFINCEISPDDRILIFFAGHGFTQTGIRGEVGFLCPCDGDHSNLSSLIRWDELTRNAELIVAKHMLFIMDACYGGLAIKRTLPAGNKRFLVDMLRRYSQQVLTAGKPDEVVSDSGGPIAGHSVFTGHLLQGLQGNAATQEGVITANGIMAYVYNQVGNDRHSEQTPHYGFLDGDGDFIFKAPSLNENTNKEQIGSDLLILVPTPSLDIGISNIDDLVEKTKDYLSDDKYSIKLYDLFNQKLRDVVASLTNDQFKAHGIAYSDDELKRRINYYEEITKNIQAMIACVGFWGNENHYQLLSNTIARVCDHIKLESGLTIWLGLRWYPAFLLIYSAGISAVAGRRYKALSTLLTTKVPSIREDYATIEIPIPLGVAAEDLNDGFKRLPGHERHFVPRSEYLFKLLQPLLDDLLFLGKDYDQMFDRFEIFLALVNADLTFDKGYFPMSLMGRFGWKYGRRGSNSSAFAEIMKEANALKSEWPPLKTGLFSGSFDHFQEVATKFEKTLEHLHWGL